jgi:hypothetical protein
MSASITSGLLARGLVHSPVASPLDSGVPSHKLSRGQAAVLIPPNRQPTPMTLFGPNEHDDEGSSSFREHESNRRA